MATPEHIMKRLRLRHDLAEGDVSKDAELDALPPVSKLREIITWELGNTIWADQLLSWANDCGLHLVDPTADAAGKDRAASPTKGQLSALVKNLLGVGDAFSLGLMNGILRHGMDFDAATEHARDLVTKIAKTGASDAYSIEVLNSMVDDLYEAARTDKLTGLLMRAAFEKEYCRLQDGWNALILIDCDHFKSVNDTLGHDVGDTVLRNVASIIRSCIRAIDVTCRWGGDEFVVFLPRAELENATVVAERIRQAAADADLRGVTLSIGVTTTQQEEILETAIRRADSAMYSAKRGGKNAVASI